MIEVVTAGDDALQMPPEGDRLTAEQIAKLRQWVAEGAQWPVELAAQNADESHWAFQPVTRAAVPVVDTPPVETRHPVDAFLMAKLAEHGLQMSPQAKPRSFIRRATLDLTGVPPTPEEVEAFVRDCEPAGEAAPDLPDAAVRRLVDRLLESPRYGERWAQHWLDVIRYADTSGYEKNAIRPSAWPYRDYVIAALNADIPYPQFILEQLAGDTLGVDPATGFLLTAPFPSRIEVGQEAASIAQARFNGLDEVLQNVSSALLGMTVGCARCHDHKFDPVSTRDYYRLAATFAGLQFVDRPWRSGELPNEEIVAAERRLADIRRELGAFATWRETEPIRAADVFQPVRAKWVRLTVTDTFQGKKYAAAFDEVQVWTPQAAGLPPRNVACSASGAKARSSGAAGTLGALDEFLNDGKGGRESQWIAANLVGKGETWVELELPEPMVINRVSWSCDHDDQGADVVPLQWRTIRQWHVQVAEQPGEWRSVVSPDRRDDVPDADRRKGLEEQFAAAATHLWELTHFFGGRFRSPDLSYVLRRGDPQQLREPTGPGGIDVLGGYELPLDAPESERRVALAKWLGSEQHPLTARVLVNRVWRHHFGAGIVDTPSDFGTQGEQPTHPELLDWLASEFMARDWRLKELHRLICTSAAYRQSSRPNAAAARIDADARLLWRFPPRRLEAEALRDSVLFANGSLDLSMGGPGVNIYKPKRFVGEWEPQDDPGPQSWRRTIYLMRMRGADDGVFKPFDVPDCGQVRAKRSTSTTPLQALNLFNSPFMIEQAQRLAARALREVGDDVDQQIERAYAVTLGRGPEPDERSACRAVVQEHGPTGLATVCRVLLNSNEFLFLE